mmetsp:Transcript_1776/g.4124  ORF Transcript_1776/g.4124 Transcript_1776/m.4124 type:complete len:227 (-) Transcript_1776:3811-4491(-)
MPIAVSMVSCVRHFGPAFAYLSGRVVATASGVDGCAMGLRRKLAVVTLGCSWKPPGGGIGSTARGLLLPLLGFKVSFAPSGEGDRDRRGGLTMRITSEYSLFRLLAQYTSAWANFAFGFPFPLGSCVSVSSEKASVVGAAATSTCAGSGRISVSCVSVRLSCMLPSRVSCGIVTWTSFSPSIPRLPLRPVSAGAVPGLSRSSFCSLSTRSKSRFACSCRSISCCSR